MDINSKIKEYKILQSIRNGIIEHWSINDIERINEIIKNIKLNNVKTKVNSSSVYISLPSYMYNWVIITNGGLAKPTDVNALIVKYLELDYTDIQADELKR